MNFFTDFFENIKSSLENHKKQTIIVCSVFIFMTLCALIVLFVSNYKPAQKKFTNFNQKLELSETPLIPQSELYSESYISSRKTPKKWSKDEAKEYFTLPSKSEVQKLSNANDKIVNEILGATP